MDIDKIIQLIDKVDASGISSLTVEEGCLKISIEKSKGHTAVMEELPGVVKPGAYQPSIPVLAETVQSAEKTEDKSVYISCPLVGVFYSSSGPDAEPFVKVGDTVKKGQVVGIVEAMKLMNEIECDTDGVIEEILVENAQGVEYGQSLFKLK